MKMIEWSGINALLYYGPTLVRSIGLSGDTLSLLVSGGIGIIQFLAVLPAIFYIDRLGAHLTLFQIFPPRFRLFRSKAAASGW